MPSYKPHPTSFVGIDWGPGSASPLFSYIFRDAHGQLHRYDSLEDLRKEHREVTAQQVVIPRATDPTYFNHVAGTARPGPWKEQYPEYVEYARTDTVHTQKLYERLYGSQSKKRNVIERDLMIIDLRIAKTQGEERKAWQRERRLTQLRLQRLS